MDVLDRIESELKKIEQWTPSTDEGGLLKIKALVEGALEEIAQNQDDAGGEEFSRYTPFSESRKIAEDGTVPITIIKAGWGNKRDNHYYPAKMLEQAVSAFEGAQMFIDHPTPEEERKRPERSVKDLGAVITRVEGVQEGELVARARIVQPWLRDLIETAGDVIGISVRGKGITHKGTVGGRTGNIVEAIPRVDSVDFVTKAGAGGRVRALYESARKKEDDMFEDKTDEEVLAALKESKGTVVDKLREEIKSELKEDNGDVQELDKLREANDKHAKEIEELNRELAMRKTREAVTEAVKGTRLPEVSQRRVIEAIGDSVFEKDEERDTAIKEAIKAEAEYVTKLTGSGEIRGLGESGGVSEVKEAQQGMDKLLDVDDEEPEGLDGKAILEALRGLGKKEDK